jgi:hypothetical protein
MLHEGLLTNIGSRRCAAMWCLAAAFKAHLGLNISAGRGLETDASKSPPGN